MSDHREKASRKQQQHDMHEQMHGHTHTDKDDETTDREEWNPSPKQMEEYLDREVEMAQDNLLLVLQARGNQSFRDLKESMLHSAETVDEALKLQLQAGHVKEERGRFSLS